ncbi:hypothetical protein ACIP4U_40565 [Streptomyces caelestis]|uniref:Uncharacterized protein n=1 Tax=Streptomyces caelestis TaxID=36816 RepID=A0A7W9GY07_9ACTN|nr:hypothetical protein [Streptomyces caelestis]MBB5792094.1 hypothetical protein [Streptomyces caelestis]
MTDFSDVSRAGSGAARAARLGWRIHNQRRWYRYLRYQAVVNALMLGDDVDYPTPPEAHEAALRLCEILDALFVPLEVQTGIFNKLGRWLREKITHGVRYPLHDGRNAQTYWDRLYRWAKAAAETDGGREALDFARFPNVENRAHIFAQRVVAKTSALLLSHALPDEGLNEVRDRMSIQVHRGQTRTEAVDTHRRVIAIARTATAGVASTFVLHVGFDQDLTNSLTVGGAALASAAVHEVTTGAFRALTEPMLAARRQARAWLATMPMWLIHYVTWRDGLIRRGQGDGIHQLLSIVTAIRANDAKLGPLQDTERVEHHLKRLIENANRVGDSELESALMNLESAVLYLPERILNSLTALIALVDGLSEVPGPEPDAGVPGPMLSGSVPPQLASWDPASGRFQVDNP